jgi:hypothetical protein
MAPATATASLQPAITSTTARPRLLTRCTVRSSRWLSASGSRRVTASEPGTARWSAVRADSTAVTLPSVVAAMATTGRSASSSTDRGVARSMGSTTSAHTFTALVPSQGSAPSTAASAQVISTGAADPGTGPGEVVDQPGAVGVRGRVAGDHPVDAVDRGQVGDQAVGFAAVERGPPGQLRAGAGGGDAAAKPGRVNGAGRGDHDVGGQRRPPGQLVGEDARRQPAEHATGRRFASPAVRISARYEPAAPSWWTLNQTAPRFTSQPATRTYSDYRNHRPRQVHKNRQIPRPGGPPQRYPEMGDLLAATDG